jgi:hypothetical protein
MLVEHSTRPTTKNRAGHNPVRILLVEDNPAEIHLFDWPWTGKMRSVTHEIRDGAAALQYIEEYRETRVDEPEPCVIVKSAELEKFMRVAQEILEICHERSVPSAA